MTPRPPASEPRLEILEVCWRFVGPSNRIFGCGLYRTDVGYEIRAGYGDDDLRRSQRVVDLDAGRELATEWREAVMAKGSFVELPGLQRG